MGQVALAFGRATLGRGGIGPLFGADGCARKRSGGCRQTGWIGGWEGRTFEGGQDGAIGCAGNGESGYVLLIRGVGRREG